MKCKKADQQKPFDSHYGGFERLNNWPTPGEALAVLSQFDQASLIGDLLKSLADMASLTTALWIFARKACNIV